jgi:hypothetical protein
VVWSCVGVVVWRCGGVVVLRWCGDAAMWWYVDRNLCYSMPHAVRVLQTGKVISRGGCFTSSFRLLLAKRVQQASKYRVFFPA